MAIGLLTIISESPLLFVINYQGDLDADSTIYVFTSGSFAGFCLLLLINCDNRYFGTGRSALNAINGGLTGMVSTLIEKYSNKICFIRIKLKCLFFLVSPEPISRKLCRKHPWVKWDKFVK